MRRFVFCSYVFSVLFSIAITSLEEERTILSDFRTFFRMALVLFCLFLLPLSLWEGLQLVMVVLSRLFVLLPLVCLLLSAVRGTSFLIFYLPSLRIETFSTNSYPDLPKV